MAIVMEKKTEFLTVRISPGEAKFLEMAAGKNSLSVGEYVRWCINTAGVIQENAELVVKIRNKLKAAMDDFIRKEFPVQKDKKKAG